MASGSLTIRDELVWELDPYGEETEELQSSIFFLMNSEWQLQIKAVVCDCSAGLGCGTIYLINKAEGEFKPFKVSTFIENTGNNVKMECSTTTVTKTRFALHNAGCDLIQRLIKKEVAIIVRFLQSTGLAVKQDAVDDGPFDIDLRIRQILVWETRKPIMLNSCESPIFSLMNSYWKLEIHSEEESDQERNSDCGLIYKILLKNCDEVQADQLNPFVIFTCLEEKRDFKEIQCSTLIISSTSETLYQASYQSIYEKLPGLKLYNDFIVSCYFCPSTGLELSINKETDPVQATSKIFLPDVERLSVDFSNLLDSGVMTDIQVKSGECIIPAHKAVLAARSRILSKKIQNVEMENGNAVIDLEDVKPPVLPIFLRYLYSGRILHELSEEMICELYKISIKYEIPTLRKLCFYYMIRNLNRENVMKILDLAYEQEDEELKVAAARFKRNVSD